MRDTFNEDPFQLPCNTTAIRFETAVGGRSEPPNVSMRFGNSTIWTHSSTFPRPSTMSGAGASLWLRDNGIARWTVTTDEHNEVALQLAAPWVETKSIDVPDGDGKLFWVAVYDDGDDSISLIRSEALPTLLAGGRPRPYGVIKRATEHALNVEETLSQWLLMNGFGINLMTSVRPYTMLVLTRPREFFNHEV